jgi:hypothetical protein
MRTNKRHSRGGLKPLRQRKKINKGFRLSRALCERVDAWKREHQQRLVKQLGAAAVQSPPGPAGVMPIPMRPASERLPVGGLRDRKGGDMSEWPESLKVRQFPLDDVCKASHSDQHRRREIMEDDQP